jgi:hypothetical protein
MAFNSLADVTGFGGSAGGGKASHINSLVQTPKGWVKIGDLAVGDSVIDPTTGGSTTVIGVFPQGECDLYEVEFDDGAKTKVVDWHLWSYKRGGHFSIRPGTKGSSQRDEAKALLGSDPQHTRWSTLRVGPTTDLIKALAKGQRPRIPLTEPVLFTVNGRSGTGAMPAYMAGLMLGDGCCRFLSMAAADDEIQDYLLSYGFTGDRYRRAENGRPLSWQSRGDFRKTLDCWLRDNGLRHSYSYEKFIPPFVFTAPLKYRVEFLQGLMDSDGTADERGRCYFISTSRVLSEGVQELVRGLGGKARIRDRQTQFTYKGDKKDGLPSFQVRVWMPRLSAIFKLSRKKARCTDSWNGGYELMREVVAVRKVERDHAVCIKLSSPHGLYLTDDYIVTHNTDLACGLALTQHQRSLIIRREGTQLQGIYDRLQEIIGNRDGFNSQDRIWRLPKRQIEFGSTPNPGDEQKYQGRAHDLKVFDETTGQLEYQVRYIMGWNRTSVQGQRSRTLMTFNPPTTSEGRWVIKFYAPWLDDKHPNPAKAGELRWFATVKGEDFEVEDGRQFVMDGERRRYEFREKDYRPEDIIQPKSRTFIPSRVSDNPYYMGTGYVATLQSLPEPLRSQMLNGDFMAGVEDDPWQVIPTAWVDYSMSRWDERQVQKGTMDSLGVDVARGGQDESVISRRHGTWFDKLLTYPGSSTPDGPTLMAQVIAARKDMAPIHIDIIGVGGSPHDFMKQNGMQVLGIDSRVSATGVTKDGLLAFYNMRSQLWWRMREALDPSDPNAVILPPDTKLRADLCAPLWKHGVRGVQVELKEETKKRIGRSPDRADAVIMALIATIKTNNRDRGRARSTGQRSAWAA